MIAGIAQSLKRGLGCQDMERRSWLRVQNKVLRKFLELNYNVKDMKVRVIVERGSDNKYSAYMDYYDLDFGLAGFGDTAKDAIQDFFESYNEEKAMCQKEGREIPEFEFDIQYDVSSFLDYFSGVLSKSGLETITGINQKQLWHYSSGLRKPRPSTVLHIQDSLHAFADTIKQVHFVK